MVLFFPSIGDVISSKRNKGFSSVSISVFGSSSSLYVKYVSKNDISIVTIVAITATTTPLTLPFSGLINDTNPKIPKEKAYIFAEHKAIISDPAAHPNIENANLFLTGKLNPYIAGSIIQKVPETMAGTANAFCSFDFVLKNSKKAVQVMGQHAWNYFFYNTFYF